MSFEIQDGKSVITLKEIKKIGGLYTAKAAVKYLQGAFQDNTGYQKAVIWGPALLEAVRTPGLLTFLPGCEVSGEDYCEEKTKEELKKENRFAGREFTPLRPSYGIHIGAVLGENKLYIEDGCKRIKAMQDEKTGKFLVKNRIFKKSFYNVFIHLRETREDSICERPYFNRPDQFNCCV